MSKIQNGPGKWFLADITTLHHETQLVCLPHSGGCASTYREWLAGLSEFVDVLPVQLPGRETRAREPCVTDMHALVDELADALLISGFGSIALFGHSLGAVMAVKACQALEAAGAKVAHVFVSGHRAPPPVPEGSHEDRPATVPLDASDAALESWIASLDPDRASWLNSQDLREVFLPVLRADMLLVSSVRLGGERIDAPVTALAGLDDPMLRGYDLGDWSRVTRASCVTHRLPGQHFYLSAQASAIARIVRERLGESRGPLPEPY
jgi:pyochelin biosynthesis protein PchC